MISTPIAVAVYVVLALGGLLPWIAGGIVARRSADRFGREARFASLAFFAVPASILLAVFIPLSISLVREQLFDQYSTVSTFQWATLLTHLLQTAAILLVAIALYRLARRVTHNASPTTDQ